MNTPMPSSFAEAALVLYQRGWRGLLPLRPYSKAPAVTGWQRFNRGQSEQELLSLIHGPFGRVPGSGVGCAAGNGIEGVDIDMLNPEAAARTVEIAEEILGETPLHRVGCDPKVMLFYRSDSPYLRRSPHGLGLELYPAGQPGASGQFVLVGHHPKTQRPYRWVKERVSQVPLDQVPFVDDGDLVALMDALSRDPVIQEHGMVAPRRGGYAGAPNGLSLSEAKTAMREGGLAPWLSEMAPGARHAAGVCAASLVIGMGLDSDAEADLLDEMEGAFAFCKPDAADGEWDRIAAWARANHRPPHSRSDLTQRLGLVGTHLGLTSGLNPEVAR